MDGEDEEMSTPKRTGGGNVFPCHFDAETLATCQSTNNTPETAEELAAKMVGITRRQWYAGLAMQGMAARGDERTFNGHMDDLEMWRKTLAAEDA
jgi:hypothetical protein